jgi:signal transduction histidine kinase
MIMGPAVITVAMLPFRSSVGLGGFLFCTLLVVIAVAVIGGAWPALAGVVLGVLAGAFFFAPPYENLSVDVRPDLVSLVAFVIVGPAAGILIGKLAQLAEEHASSGQVEAALRRVATLVAGAAQADELFGVVTEEAGRLLDADFAALGRYEPDDEVTLVAAWSRTADFFPVGRSWTLEGENISGSVLRTGRPVRVDDFADLAGPLAADARARGTRSEVGAPIIVEGRIWGVMVAGLVLDRLLPPDAEARLASVTDLLATAIANAESRSDLDASRARIVAASDEARRRIERDLHDGAQQRLVTLGLALAAAQTAVPPQLGELDSELADIAQGLASVLDELREMARGIHPAILAKGGLGPALTTLARRCPVPVELDVRAAARLPERVEVAAYYVVSEALTNAVKHAHASVVSVEVEAVEGTVRLHVRDDGAGGADPVQGSGLVGLKDRVEALGGTLIVQSPAGAGTALHVELPLDG